MFTSQRINSPGRNIYSRQFHHPPFKKIATCSQELNLWEKKKILSIRSCKIIIYLTAKIESFSEGKINILNDKFRPFSLQEKLIKNKIRREKYFFNSFRAKSLIFVIMLFTRIGLNPPSEKKKSSIIIFPPVKEYERSLKKNFVNWR